MRCISPQWATKVPVHPRFTEYDLCDFVTFTLAGIDRLPALPVCRIGHLKQREARHLAMPGRGITATPDAAIFAPPGHAPSSLDDLAGRLGVTVLCHQERHRHGGSGSKATEILWARSRQDARPRLSP